MNYSPYGQPFVDPGAEPDMAPHPRWGFGRPPAPQPLPWYRRGWNSVCSFGSGVVNGACDAYVGTVNFVGRQVSAIAREVIPRNYVVYNSTGNIFSTPGSPAPANVAASPAPAPAPQNPASAAPAPVSDYAFIYGTSSCNANAGANAPGSGTAWLMQGHSDANVNRTRRTYRAPREDSAMRKSTARWTRPGRWPGACRTLARTVIKIWGRRASRRGT